MPAQPAHVLSVTELTHRVKDLLEERFRSVWVEGEISNLRSPASGHVYFTLKDATAQLAVVLFRGVAAKVGFTLKDGLQVIAFGDISVYEKSGQYQLVARQLLPKGLGALQLAFEELKQRLAKEGLFDPSRKKPIPALPQRIGLITSPTGAAIRDFLKIIGRRFPNVHIVINPVRVQGDGAAQEIADAIDRCNALHTSHAFTFDVLVVTRGGGSLEDLWAFNEEIVARALARSRIPTISAVGHEIDFTISDFVADLRAPTPSAAAELVVKAKEEFLKQLAQSESRLQKDLRLCLAEARQRLSDLGASYIFRRPTEIIRQYDQQVDDLGHRLPQATGVALGHLRTRLETAAAKFRLLSPQARVLNRRQQLAADQRRFQSVWAQVRQGAQHRLAQVAAKLELLSPNSTLQRGYSITRVVETGQIVRRKVHVRPGLKISTKVLDGEFGSVVSFPTDSQ
ncbi:MAG TPA: exodeoxyribonuclease VII large subunit [Verrucomicrobiae bacterium]|nr:exodeoxyribonuclease VII large subunit [Verrucomicrobiae bacterium]